MRLPIYLFAPPSRPVRAPRSAISTTEAIGCPPVNTGMSDHDFHIRQHARDPLVFLILNPRTGEASKAALKLYEAAEVGSSGVGPLVRSSPVWAAVRTLFAGAAERELFASEVGTWLLDWGDYVQIDASQVFDREPLHLTFTDRDAAVLFKMIWL